MSAYTIGLEFSTQSAKIVVLDIDRNEIAHIDSFNYDTTFPEYKTQGGVLPSESPDIRHTSPLMILDALNLCFKRLADSTVNLSNIKVIKTDGMQHCTVYSNKTIKKTLKTLDPEANLKSQLSRCFSRQTLPIWEDRSTREETVYLTKSLAENGGIINLTGNRAELRFPASQILKWARENPTEYENTDSIFLLSAFITSILCGKVAPVDTGDGWGTNLNDLDINNPGWNEAVLDVMDTFIQKHECKSSLQSKIGRIDHYDSVSGSISPYFSDKYGVNPQAVVLTGTGDNPATLLGCGGKIVISLGSSYTVNGIMADIMPSSDGEYNVFGYTKGTGMALSVITNGGKVHEFFYNKYINSDAEKNDWAKYIAAAGSPVLQNDENILLPYLLDESVPLHKSGIIRDGFDENDPGKNIRALILSQVLSLKTHSKHFGNIDELCVVGGGADNELMMQWIADAFNARTYKIDNFASAAPIGCAVSGAVNELGISYKEAADRFVKKDEGSIHVPIPENRDIIEKLCLRYMKLEENAK